jgi:hypothetical protein
MMGWQPKPREALRPATPPPARVRRALLSLTALEVAVAGVALGGVLASPGHGVGVVLTAKEDPARCAVSE